MLQVVSNGVNERLAAFSIFGPSARASSGFSPSNARAAAYVRFRWLARTQRHYLYNYRNVLFFCRSLFEWNGWMVLVCFIEYYHFYHFPHIFRHSDCRPAIDPLTVDVSFEMSTNTTFPSRISTSTIDARAYTTNTICCMNVYEKHACRPSHRRCFKCFGNICRNYIVCVGESVCLYYVL